jgi:Dolichyl-phosphate-mannose-protein mannosyltransferase
MMISERIQAFIHKLEVDPSFRWVNYVPLTLLVLLLAIWYNTHDYRDFNTPEAMDAAQVGRNLSEGKGFTTEFIRPFSIYLLQKHNHALAANPSSSTNAVDTAEIYGQHPDLANAPLYPVVLAGLFKITQPAWPVEMHKPFWSNGGRFERYKPEFIVALFNQILLLAAVLLTFIVARAILDITAAWLSAILMLFSDKLWELSVSGLPTLLLMVIFLGLIWTLTSFETLWREENPESRRQYVLAALAGLLTGLGMLTRYSFGWVLVPVFLFFILFGRTRRTELAAVAVLVAGLTVAPWLARNFLVSGTLFGTAGYAVVEGTFAFPGSRLMQSLTPDMTSAYWIRPYLVKLAINLRSLLQDEMLRLGGGWIGILFLTGLLLGLRNVVARRLRYFTMICLGVFMVVTALGRTQLSTIEGDMSTENLLVLLTPLVVIFGVGFFLTLLNQMNFPSLEFRYATMILVILLIRLQFILTLLPPKASPIAYPPYFPPDIQKFSGWMQPNELIMSDIPWAVAWYGDRQCTWTTINSQYEFFQFNDYIKPVRALYLTLNTLDAKLFSECLQGGVDSWPNFALKTVAANQIPKQFPLKAAPYGLQSGLFLTDRQRWEAE